MDISGVPFLQKPFTPQTLLETIDTILAKSDREPQPAD
jgi:FixJ family two-component response regulator